MPPPESSPRADAAHEEAIRDIQFSEVRGAAPTLACSSANQQIRWGVNDPLVKSASAFAVEATFGWF